MRRTFRPSKFFNFESILDFELQTVSAERFRTPSRFALLRIVSIDIFRVCGTALAFWMNFWGRWSKFKITPEKGKCIDCNVCNQFCQMGIDIKSRALQGKPVTLDDTPCVVCAECVMRCPMEILHLGDVPDQPLHQIGNLNQNSKPMSKPESLA